MSENLRRRRSEDSLDPNMADRIPIERVQKYESVLSHDTDGLDDDDDNNNDRADSRINNNKSNSLSLPSDEELSDDGGELGFHTKTGKRRRRTRAPPLHDGGSVVLNNAKILLFVFVIVLGAVLIMWQSTTKAAKKKHTQDKSDNKEWNIDDDQAFIDDDEINSYIKTGGTRPKARSGNYNVTYDLSWMKSDWNPFNLQTNSGRDDDGNTQTEWNPPALTWTPDKDDPGAYLMFPDVNNRLLVFISEGDLYVTQYARKGMNTPQPAAKLTTTVGNVRTPRLHPHLPVVAFTATYQGRREAYIQDLRTHTGATRLTYWDTEHGVTGVVGWKDDKTLLIVAKHTSVALPDLRLFALTLASDDDPTATKHAVMDITPIPLAQAQDAAIQSFDNGKGETIDCYYFVRNSQTSHTLRYVGGTVEQLWAYCDGHDTAVPLTTDYKGTSKSPMLWSSASSKQDYLLFASDRILVDEDGWKPGTMNVWAMALPPPTDLYKRKNFKPPSLVQVTDFACWEQGRTLQEVRVDPNKQNLVLRMGADLFEISSSEVEGAVSNGKPVSNAPQIAVQAVSDFHETQERLIPVSLPNHLINADVLTLPTGHVSALLTLRGQTWMAPTLHDTSLSKPYQGGGQNIPPRRYRVAPGALTGGSMRVLQSIHVPMYGDDTRVWGRRLALVLATDPLSPTAEHAFYLLQIQESALSAFADLEHAPKPFLGGNVNGGSTKDGGLGSVLEDSVAVSPCGRRLAWADTDGRISVLTLPLFDSQHNQTVEYKVLPDTNELSEPLDGTLVDLLWSPGGRYLAITHAARNKFSIISIADCGDPLDGNIALGRIVQATPSRFNSMSPYWGFSPVDIELDKYASMLAKAKGDSSDDKDKATTLYFLTDRDILNDASSPWGTRAPMPHFARRALLYALPLLAKGSNGSLDPNLPLGRFSGGAPMEVFAADIQALTIKIKNLLKGEISGKQRLEDTSRRLAQVMVRRGLSADSPELERLVKADVNSDVPTTSPTSETKPKEPLNPFPVDIDIEFGLVDLSFARRAYRMVNVPESNYYQILTQTDDNGSLLLVDASKSLVASIKVFSAAAYPYDEFKAVDMATPGKRLISWGLSTDRKFVYLILHPGNVVKILRNSLEDVGAAVAEFAKGSASTHIADVEDLTLSVWPRLEYRQLFSDAWRMLRDYFWDVQMHQLDWPGIHSRYIDLVDRCKKREELDDVLAQMAAELSALHVFVYGGEYNSPFGGDEEVQALHEPASLGVSLERSPGWKGYMIKEIPVRDPDFNLVTTSPVYSPLSHQALWQTGQKGLQVGDVIVAVNGESVMRVPDIAMLLRGMAGRSVRLEVLRLVSGNYNATDVAVPEPVLVVPLTQDAASNLRYNAWEYRTRELAKSLASEAGFTVGYAHLRAMGSKDVNAFAQGFFEDYDKQTLILVSAR